MTIRPVLRDDKIRSILDESKPMEMRLALALQKIEYLNDRLTKNHRDHRVFWKKKLHDQRDRYESEIKELKREFRQELKLTVRELEDYKKAGAKTLSSLLTMLKYAGSYLANHDPEAAEKVLDVYERASQRLQPVADVPQLVDLLRRWVEAAPLADLTEVASMISETEQVLDELSERNKR